ncbi:MAG: ATP-binding cassette domain-containing protein, partial [Candidatus Aminicenantaceae bacterium]
MLLKVENLRSFFFLDEGILRAVDDISFQVNEEETVALVGESGCGKTIVALSIINLIPSPGRVVNGKIYFNGQDLLKMNPEQMRRTRGKEIGMVFQEPTMALNPVFTVGFQIIEVLKL